MNWVYRALTLITLLIFNFSSGQISNVYNELRNINFKIPATDTIIGWKREGNARLNFGQVHYENWVKNNNSRLNFESKLNQRIFYIHRKTIWDNKIYLQYGLSKLYGENIQKSTDLIEINSIYGRIINPKFSYSYFINFKTQFSNSYDLRKDKDKEYRISGFMSPFYITSGAGLMWRRDNNFYINFAPLTWRLTSIISPVNRYNKQEKKFLSNEETEVFGINKGENSIHRLGLNASLYQKYTFFKKWTIENRLNFYSNYLDEPENIDLDYTFNTSYKINKYISTNFMVQALYENKAFSGFQIRENFSIGLNLNI